MMSTSLDIISSWVGSKRKIEGLYFLGCLLFKVLASQTPEFLFDRLSLRGDNKIQQKVREVTTEISGSFSKASFFLYELSV